MPLPAAPDDPQPVAPAQPDLDECCGSGCNPCIFDLFDAAMERYREQLREWTARQAEREAGEAGG